MSAPTPCPACGAHTTGIDCETCGAPGTRQCPSCQRPFGAADRFCQGCGHSLKYCNFSNRTILRIPRELPLESFQYPPDREALWLLDRTGPVKLVSRFLQQNWSEQIVLGSLEGSAIQVTAKQFPRIRRIADTCERILHMKSVDVFIKSDPGLGAFAFGSEKICGVVLTSGLIDNLNERELLFVLGREMGHLRADHMFYANMIKMVTDNKLLQTIPFFGEGLRAFVMLFLLPWQRKSQVTADRAGLLCCQNRVTAVKSLIKMALGAKSLYDKVDVEEFLSQGEELATRRFSVKNMGEYLSGSPYVVNRVKEIEAYASSQPFHGAMVNSLDPYMPGFICPSCKAMVHPDNLEEGLMRLSCKACGAAVHVQSLPCPHCGKDVEAGEVGMRDRVCAACEQPFLSAALRELMPETGEYYRILGVPPQATREEIREAFLRHVKLRKSILERIPYYRAFRNLFDPTRRKAYDDKLGYLGSQGRRRKHVAVCSECDCPVTAEYCGYCGKKKDDGKAQREREQAARAARANRPSYRPEEPPPPERPAGPIN